MKKRYFLFSSFLIFASIFLLGEKWAMAAQVSTQTYCCSMSGYSNSCGGMGLTSCDSTVVPAPMDCVGSCPIASASVCTNATQCPPISIGPGRIPIGGFATPTPSPGPSVGVMSSNYCQQNPLLCLTGVQSSPSPGPSISASPFPTISASPVPIGNQGCNTDLCCQRTGFAYYSTTFSACENDPVCAIGQTLVNHVCVAGTPSPTPSGSPTPSPTVAPSPTPSSSPSSTTASGTTNSTVVKGTAAYSAGNVNGGTSQSIQNTDSPTNWNLAAHRCDAGNVANPNSISTVSSRIPPVPNQNQTIDASGYSQRFNNTVNKKLACCLNVKNSNFASYVGAPTSTANNSFFEKFDCDENPADKTKSFDDLWASTSDDTDLGQPNALMLVNSAGKVISGFYTTDLKRCDEFSEFSPYDKPIVPGVLTPTLTKDIQQATTKGSLVGAKFDPKTPLSVPSSPTWIALASGINKPPPRCDVNADDCRRCPILVRAAMVSTCPTNDSFTYPPAAQPGTIKHCAAAGSVTIYVKVQQVFEIAGTKPIKTMDTVIENGKAVPISVEQLMH